MSAPSSTATATPDGTEAGRRAPWWAAVVIVVATLAAYANSLHGPFVFDDASSIVTNPTIQDLSSMGTVLAGPPTNVTAQGRPVFNLSLAVNYALGGTNVVGYHVANIVIHALAALCLFGLVRRTFALMDVGAERRVRYNTPDLGAFVVALLWAVHPLQTESVTYVIQRAESLMGLFYLLTVYAFVRSTESEAGRIRWQVLAVAACALGMATKEVMVTAPLMVLFYDRTLVAPSFAMALRRRWKFYAALAATWLIVVALLWQSGGNRGGSVGFGVGLDPWAYWLTQFQAVATYLRLTVWPEPLVFEYGTLLVGDLVDVAVEALLVLTLLAVTVHGLLRRSAVGFAGAWFFGILAPTSLAPGTTQMIVEHRMYLSLAAVLAVGVAGSFRWVGAGGARWLLAGWLAVALVAGGLTVRRNLDYRTDLGLWRDTVVKRPENPLAHFMLAGAQERLGQTDAALASYEEAVRLKPNFSVGQENLGELLLKLGRRAEAIARFEAALRLQPEYADAHMNLGNALVAEGRVADAVPHLREAARIAPRMAEMRFNLGNALAAVGQPAEAIAEFKAALSLKAVNPAVHVAANYELANLLAMTGRPAEAVPYYEAALKVRPDLVAAQHNLGSALLQLGRFDEAVRAYETVLRLEADLPNTRALLERAKARQRP